MQISYSLITFGYRSILQNATPADLQTLSCSTKIFQRD